MAEDFAKDFLSLTPSQDEWEKVIQAYLKMRPVLRHRDAGKEVLQIFENWVLESS